MSGWVYIKSRYEPGLYVVGFYKPDGEWEPESDHHGEESAAERVHYLNGGDRPLNLHDDDAVPPDEVMEASANQEHRYG